MATLTGSAIADSYDQLIALPTGGGNGATLVALTDGNAGNTFALKLSTGEVNSTGTLTATGAATLSTSVTLATGATVTGIDNGDLATGSATLLATQGAVKTYVDAQVGASDALSEVLANGNTTGSTNIIVTAGQSITTDTISETTSAAGVTIDSVLVKDNTVTATTFTGALTGNVTGNASGSSGSCTGNSATVTNGVYTTNNLSALAATTSAQLAGVISNETGSGSLVFATSPTLVTPALGTPASGVLTNCTALPAAQVAQGTMASGMVLVAPALGTPASGVATNLTGTAASLTAGTVTTNANLTGDVTSSGNATTIAAGAVDIAMLSATGSASSSTYLTGDNAWTAISGDVSKVGTPVDNQVGVWTGDGTIEGTSSLVFDSTGLGIGASAPVSLLDVRGPTGTGTASAGVLTLATNELTIVDNDQLGRIEFRSPIATAGTDAIVSAAAIWAEANATFSASVNSADIVFATATSGAASERLRLTSAGLLGVGTAIPTYTVDIIAASFTSDIGLRINSTGTDTAAGLILENDSRKYSIRIKGDDDFSIRDLNASADRLTVTQTGDTGIGIQAPANFLSVSPVQYSTGTASQSGTTVTGSGTTWTAAMVGSEFVYADATSSGAITARASNTSITVTTSQTVSSQAYQIHYQGLQVSSSGNVGIGTSGSPAALLDIQDGSIGLLLGADDLATTRGATSNKQSRIAQPHYTLSEEPLAIIHGGSTSSTGSVLIGGGTASCNASTGITFWTAANNTTTTGTERMTISSAGLVGIGGTPSKLLHVVKSNSYAARIGGASYYWDMGQKTTDASPSLDAIGTSASAIFRVNGTEHMRIRDSGRVTVKKSSNSEITALTDASTVAIDFDDANNFSLLTTSGIGTTRALGTPSNITAGQSGCIVITSDASSRALTYTSAWHFEGGTDPALTTDSGGVDTLVYYCPTASVVQAVLLKDLK